MSDFAESPRSAAQSQHWPDADALRTLSLGEVTCFHRYVRKVLPIDGFVFWLREDSKDFAGSLFRDTQLVQNEDETVGLSTVTFTTTEPIQQFEDVQPNVLWVGEFDQQRFAFSRLGGFYEAANIYYYTGVALQPALATQLVDSPQGITSKSQIVSNSLPAWLQLVTYSVPWLPCANPGIVLYPSYLVSQNLAPPYGSVHIEPSETFALQQTAFLDRNGTHWQLARDLVNVTLYGLDNDAAMNFLDLVNQFSVDTDAIGMMNMPLIIDEKRTHPEMGILAMKKTVQFEVSYQQYSMRGIARQLIEQAAAIVTPRPYSPPSLILKAGVQL